MRNRAAAIATTLGSLVLISATGLTSLAVAAPNAPSSDSSGTSASASIVKNAVTNPVYSPQPGVMFNDPTGIPAEQYSMRTHINRSIAATPAGGTIRIATYTLNFGDSVNALIAARNRGVKVQVLVDDHVTTPQTAQLTTALGKNTSAGSFVKRCSRGCMGGSVGMMHAKLYLFSSAGSSKLVTMVGSANLAYSSQAYSWNNLQTVVGDKTMYDSSTKYFTDMVKDQANLNYYRTTTSGSQKAYFFPKSSSKNSVMLDALNQVTCKGASAGYGYQGRTVIRVAMYHWTSSRLDVATKLRALHDQGCVVQVIVNSPIVSSDVMKALLKKSSKYGVMPVYNALYDRDRDGVAEQYLHHKVLTINGKWNGNSRTKVVFNGSQNFTDNSTLKNNEILYRVSGAATYNAYAANLTNIRDNHARKATNVASASVLSEADIRKLASED